MRLKCKNIIRGQNDHGIYFRLGCLETNIFGSLGYISWQCEFKVGVFQQSRIDSNMTYYITYFQNKAYWCFYTYDEVIKYFDLTYYERKEKLEKIDEKSM